MNNGASAPLSAIPLNRLRVVGSAQCRSALVVLIDMVLDDRLGVGDVVLPECA
jgi:hypothetical protein